MVFVVGERGGSCVAQGAGGAGVSGVARGAGVTCVVWWGWWCGCVMCPHAAATPRPATKEPLVAAHLPRRTGVRTRAAIRTGVRVRTYRKDFREML